MQQMFAYLYFRPPNPNLQNKKKVAWRFQIRILLLMEEILHHLGWLNPSKILG